VCSSDLSILSCCTNLPNDPVNPKRNYVEERTVFERFLLSIVPRKLSQQ
jgi:hypothetical protein